MMLKKKEQILLLFLLLLVLVKSQNNFCYSNCKEGYCNDDSPSNCTLCDKGQLNLNGRCISSSSQPKQYPLKYLTANGNTSISGVSSQSSIFSCIVQKSTNKLGTLLYNTVPGATYTKQFYIPEKHQYIQFKFNAAIIQQMPVILEYEVISQDGTSLLSARQSSQASNDTTLSVQCTGNTTVSGLFYVSKSLSTDQKNLTLQIKSLDGNAVFGVSNFEIYYGSCHKKCKTCSGSTETQCLSCQGLYMQLVNGTCLTCPAQHYDSGNICKLCPKHCETCTLNNQTQQVNCTKCLPWSTLVQEKCIPKYETYSLSEQLIFNQSQSWKSSELTSQPLTVCGHYSIIGGVSIGRQGSNISKTFTNLTVHTQISIRMAFWMIDQQPDDTNLYQISVDGLIIKQEQVNITPPQFGWLLSNECGNTNPQLQFIITLNSIPHQDHSATISVSSLKNWFGFRDFTLVVNNKTSVPGCQKQVNGICTVCQRGFKYNSQKKTCSECSSGYYLTILKDSCEICPIQCKTCQLQPGIDKIRCLSCTSPLQLINGFCKDTSGAVYRRDILPDEIKPQTKNSWELYPKLPNHGVTVCGNKSIIGSSQIKYKFLQMKRQYDNLPSHRGIKIYFHFYQIDTYSNDTVFFRVNGKQYPYLPTEQKKQICGDPNIHDAIVKMEFLDENHSDGSLLFEIQAKGKAKLGVNNVILFLLNCDGCNNVVPFEIESIPLYSLSTPPVKGVEVKVMFKEALMNSTPISSAIQFSITNQNYESTPQQNTSRLLQGLIQFNENLPIVWQQIIANRQYRSFLQLSQDYIDSQLTVDPLNFWALSTDPNREDTFKLLNSASVTQKMPRYMDIDQNNVDNRTNIRNFRNLFQGCAIFALWFGIFSFIFGFSCAFDDFFILVQVIFAHIFIQLPYSPPSLRVPLQGMQIVQFMAWLPWQARVGIEKGIIPSDLYQKSPIVYEQYYKDIAYARTIYHTLLFFVLMIVLYILLLVLSHMLTSSTKSKRKYADSYIVKFYSDYESNIFSYIQKIVRFAFFTVIWACVLQFTEFNNTPTGFNIWNSILCIAMFIIFVLYPILAFLWLRKMSGQMSDSTFRRKYEDIRINSSKLFYFIWRYFKLLLIALLIGLLYDSNPIGILIPLIFVHVIDGLMILFLKPLGMEQQQQLNVCLYNYYPKVYEISSAIQSFLLAFLELFILILYAVRDSANNQSYLGLGYFCCVIIILLLINGLIKLVWGFIKIVEGCFAKSKEMKLLVENKALKQKQTNQELMPMKSLKQLQSNLNNLQSKSRLNNIRKTTLVSRIS